MQAKQCRNAQEPRVPCPVYMKMSVGAGSKPALPSESHLNAKPGQVWNLPLHFFSRSHALRPLFSSFVPFMKHGGNAQEPCAPCPVYMKMSVGAGSKPALPSESHLNAKPGQVWNLPLHFFSRSHALRPLFSSFVPFMKHGGNAQEPHAPCPAYTKMSVGAGSKPALPSESHLNAKPGQVWNLPLHFFLVPTLCVPSFHPSFHLRNMAGMHKSLTPLVPLIRKCP